MMHAHARTTSLCVQRGAGHKTKLSVTISSPIIIHIFLNGFIGCDWDFSYSIHGLGA